MHFICSSNVAVLIMQTWCETEQVVERAWHSEDAGVIQQLEAVPSVGRLAGILGCLDCLQSSNTTMSHFLRMAIHPLTSLRQLLETCRGLCRQVCQTTQTSADTADAEPLHAWQCECLGVINAPWGAGGGGGRSTWRPRCSCR